MSRKTTKSILSRDEISLLKNSEELKNSELYGNLFDILSQIENPEAITLSELISIGLNHNGITILKNNKKSIIDNINREWYVESKSAEDPNKKIRCGLCNTPNRYLFYIKNRLNNQQLNVGSHCMTKFPEIEGYANHKYQLAKIQRSQRETARWLKFHDKFPNAEDIIDSANYYFDNLPILLPYEIYFPLKNVVFQLHVIYNKYIKYGTTPTKTSKTSFELFNENINSFYKLKGLSDNFIESNLNKPYICKQAEIEWMLENKKLSLLEEISKNKGSYSMQTIGKVTSINFINKHFKKFSKCNVKYITLIPPKDNYSTMRFIIKNEGVDFLYDINIKKFMSKIGASCILIRDYEYNEKDLFNISKIVISNSNLSKIIDVINNPLKRMGYAILNDETTNDLYLYEKSYKSIKQFSLADFLNLYDIRKIRKHINSKDFIGVLITHKKWISSEEQERIGLDEKISNLYYHQYIEPYL